MKRALTIAALTTLLAGCETTPAAPSPEQSRQVVLEAIDEQCGKFKSHPYPQAAFDECVAQLMAEARRQHYCQEYLEALPPHLLKAAAEYQMLHGKRPAGIEAVCGVDAYNAHLTNARQEVQAARAQQQVEQSEPPQQNR
jgi:hypothetical protein